MEQVEDLSGFRQVSHDPSRRRRGLLDEGGRRQDPGALGFIRPLDHVDDLNPAIIAAGKHLFETTNCPLASGSITTNVELEDDRRGLIAGHFQQSTEYGIGGASARSEKLLEVAPEVDPLSYTMRWPVRGYELDSNGHVNNAVYLSWAEELATAHAEAAGYGRAWSLEQGGGWVIRRSEITYHHPALYGEVVELTVIVELVRGARGVRRTTIRRAADGTIFAEVLTEWVWVRLSDGRATSVPHELVEMASSVTRVSMEKRRVRR